MAGEVGTEVGAMAPNFELKDQHGQRVALADFRGRKNVLLVFYPYAFTGVCTGELCAIRDQVPALGEHVAVLTVSVDSIYAHRVFAEQEKLDYPLLSDFWPHGAVARSYGVFDETKGAAVRGTFIIDTAGVIRWKVVNAIPDARDVHEYRRVLESLGTGPQPAARQDPPPQA